MARHVLIWSVWAFVASVAAAQERSTWDVIQHDIFGENCASCHQSGSSYARQSDLILTPDVAYDQLVGASPHNSAALNDGLLRVSTLGDQIGIAQSYLWEKIDVSNQHHYYEDHPDYGALMPLGMPSLTNGQLDFIKEWIMQGAPATGSIADLALLNDTSRYDPEVFQPLEPPSQGFQLHLAPFDVWSAERYDREFYYFQPHETTEPTFVRGVEIAYQEGSHHLIMYHYDQDSVAPTAEEFRDIRTSAGTSINGSFNGNHASWVVAAQSPHLEYKFPDGVALRLPPGQGFDFNVHSVNRTGETRQGEVYVNFETAAADEVLHVAEQHNFAKYDITLPPHQVTTLTHLAVFNETTNIVQMWSHAHEHMTEFRVEYAGGDRDGELIYITNDWEHPPVLEQPLVFQRGQRIRMVATYNNETNSTIHYGPLSSDEMMFLFYVSHPDTPDINRDGVVNASDIDQLSKAVQRGATFLLDRYDINFDGVVDDADRVRWVERHLHTYFGDANLDGEFNSADFVEVFQAGEYEDGIASNSTWAKGDWNGDEEFTSADIVYAFQGGAYEQGPRTNTQPAAVPEPASWMLLAIGCFGVRRADLRRLRNCEC
ncbi:MAG: hypothetical protein KDB23_01105 [Planctomycetales bacterium]|nr:hypothetical protein [Planctomycetales bacterium]